MRTLIAVLVAPLATMLLALMSPENWGFAAFLTLFYGYPLMLFVGLPSYFYFRRKRWLKLWQVVGTGAVVGLIIPTLITLSFGVDSLTSRATNGIDQPAPPTVILCFPLLGAALGAISSFLFWLIAIRPETSARDTNMPSNISLQANREP
jgi:hypothetical protein